MKTSKNPKRVAAANKAWKTIKHKKIDQSAAALKAHVTRRFQEKN